MLNRSELLHDLTGAGRRALVIVLGGVVLGLTINALRPTKLALTRYEPPAVCSGAEAPKGIHVLEPAQAARLCGDARTLVADVRSTAAFAEGHVVGAVHIPCSGSSADFEHVRRRLLSKEALVVYGDSEEQARQVANDLVSRINRPELTVSVIAGGWRAWFDAGMACASGPCDDCEGLVSHAPN